MIAMDGMLGPEMPSEDAVDGGPEAVTAQVSEAFDLDRDGMFETRVLHTQEGVVVRTDLDGDGVTDTFTSFGRDGHYESWEIFREANGRGRWEMSESGEL